MRLARGQFLRLGSPAGLLADLGEPVGHFGHKGMVRTEHLLANRWGPAVEGFGFGIPAVTAAEAGKVVGGLGDVRMLGALYPLSFLQHVPIERFRFRGSASPVIQRRQCVQ